MSMKDMNEEFIRSQVRKILEEQSDWQGGATSSAWSAPTSRKSSMGTHFGKGPATAYSDYLKAKRRASGPQTKWDSYTPSADLFYETFVGPFVNIFNVAKAALKQTMADVITTIQMVMTFDLQKKKELQAKFQQNRQKYGGELQTAMQAVDASFQTPDAKLLGFMLAPAPALAYAAANTVGDVADPITSELGEKLGGFAGAFGLGDSQIRAAERKAGLAASKDRGVLRGIAHDLKVLFFGPEMGAGMPEGLDYMDRLEKALTEGDDAEEAEGEEEAEPIDTYDAVGVFIEESGLQEKFDEIGQAIIAEKKEEIEFVLNELKDNLAVLNELSKARTMSEIEPLVPKLKTLDIDISAPLSEVKQAVVDQVKAMEEGGEDADAIKKELLATEDAKTAQLTAESPPGDFAPVIETGVIAGAFTDVAHQAKAGTAEGLMDLVGEGMSKDELAALSKASEAGKEFAEVITGFESELQKILETSTS